MHRGSALPAAQRLRRAIEEDVPMSVGYSAGFLCHLALDSACHGYVDQQAAEGPICHMAIEGEYDRRLMLDDGLDVTGRAWLPSLPKDGRVWTAAARAYAHASPDQLRRAYRSMAFLTSFLARPGMWMQNFTTNEPDDSMIEVAIEAMKLVIPAEKGKDKW